MKKRVVVALGHQALGTNFPEQKKAVSSSVKILADMVEDGCQLIITPQQRSPGGHDSYCPE